MVTKGDNSDTIGKLIDDDGSGLFILNLMWYILKILLIFPDICEFSLHFPV